MAQKPLQVFSTFYCHKFITLDTHFRLQQKLQCRESCALSATIQQHNNNHFTELCPGLPGWAGTRRIIHPPTILNIIQSFSASSIYYDPTPCSNCVLGNLFAQLLSTLPGLLYNKVVNRLTNIRLVELIIDYKMPQSVIATSITSTSITS